MPLAGEYPGVLTLAGGALVLTGVMTAQMVARRRVA
jgi:hypothetical protein